MTNDRVGDRERCEIRDEVSADLADIIVSGLIDKGDLTPTAYAKKDLILLYVEDMIRDRLFTMERLGLWRMDRGNGRQRVNAASKCTCTMSTTLETTSGLGCPVHGLPTRPWSDV